MRKLSAAPRFALFLACALALPFPLKAASTGQTALHTPQGSDAAGSNGEYVADAMNTFYRYFIEVPPGVGRLVVEVWDADVGRGANDTSQGRDRERTDYNTQADYILIRPDGSQATALNNCDDNTCNDNVWTTLLNSTTAANTAAGHWELRINQTNTGDDINAIGVRAHDGTSGAGGTELPVYIDSIGAFGVNPPNSGTTSRNYDLYPWMTSGCSASVNDFDYDDSGSLTLTSRLGTFSQSYSGAVFSGNSAWNQETFSGWASDQAADDYGIWHLDLTVSSYLVSGTPNGNYINFWMGNFQAGGATPAANPVTNGIRIYLPTDGLAAPVKPYVEQFLTHKSGNNPVVVGQTSRYQVTVRVVNPTTRPIVFSAANLVTANIPGGGVLYAGNAAVGQGSIVSQPGVGGTGNITWNPGTLAAGATSILTYQVNVTPTSAGQRLLVTATPASGNGTRARYVDETGNTTQTRATFQFGPLCELAVTENLLTVAVVSSFRALPAEGGGVLVEWSTASEAGTAGFHLQRWDSKARRWTPVNRELLAGLMHAPQGGVYRFVDAGASPAEPQTYRLVEVEAGGRRRVYGPYRVSVDWNDRPGSHGAYESKAHPASRLAPAKGGGPLKLSRPIPSGPEGVHLTIEESGLYYLPVADVAGWLGLKVKDAEKELATGRFSLTRDGVPVAWRPDPSADGKRAYGLFFYGEAGGGLYAEAGVYRLQREKEGGLLMQTVSAPAAFAANGVFVETLHTERDALPATVVATDPEADYWFWAFLQGGDPSFGRQVFTLDAPGAVTGGGLLTVTLHGATATGVAGEHRVTVALNGAPLGETSWQGLEGRTASFAVPPGLLAETGNQVELVGYPGNGAPYSFTYVDGFDLSYLRSLRASGDRLAFTAETAAPLTVTGFSKSNVGLVEITDPLHPRWISGATVEPDGYFGGHRLTFAPTPGARYLAFTAAGFHISATSRPWTSGPSLRSDRRIEYVVIAPQALWVAAERLAALRRDQGLSAETVYLDQIGDEFGGGVLTPHAIRAFLTYAWETWSLKPRYVVLAGEGTLDYRNLLGYGDNLVPPLMVRAEGGLFPSDNQLGDVDGDGLPEMAVGRIPVLSTAELNAYIDKIAAYEAASPAGWSGSALFLADAPDRGADFTAESGRIAGHLAAEYAVDRIDLASMPLADARAHLLAALNGGAALLNYVGHGGLDRLSGGGLLTSADVPGLANAEKLPVVTAMTCTINRFAVPGVPSLGELLAKAPDGGAAAVWGPTGLSSSGQARLLAERFYRPGEEARLGDRVLRAIREYRELGGDPALPVLYDLLGDPALRMVAAPVGVAAPGSSGE